MQLFVGNFHFHLVQKSSPAADKIQIAFLKVLADLYSYTATELEIHVIACCLTHSSSMIHFYTSRSDTKISRYLFSEVTKMKYWPATLIAVTKAYVVVYKLEFYCTSLFFPL